MRYENEFISIEINRLGEVFEAHSEIGEWEEY